MLKSMVDLNPNHPLKRAVTGRTFYWFFWSFLRTCIIFIRVDGKIKAFDSLYRVKPSIANWAINKESFTLLAIPRTSFYRFQRFSRYRFLGYCNFWFTIRDSDLPLHALAGHLLTCYRRQLDFHYCDPWCALSFQLFLLDLDWLVLVWWSFLFLLLLFFLLL